MTILHTTIRSITRSQQRSSLPHRIRGCQIIAVVISPSSSSQQQQINKNYVHQRSISSSLVVSSSSTTTTSVAVPVFHFATTEYADSLFTKSSSSRNNQHQNQQPTQESAAALNNETMLLRQQALHYCNHIYDPKLWFNDPIISLVNGQKLQHEPVRESNNDDFIVDTYDAMGNINGKQILANPTQIAYIQSHIQMLHTIWSSSSSSMSNSSTTTSTDSTPNNDLRKQIRHVENLLLTRHVGYLIGNQCIDYYKQDGVTEIEEAIAVNRIERHMNDMLLQQERAGIVSINRQPIYVHTVSNFSNFLDLCRKVLRSIEVGIPVIILCRTNYTVTQHSYRWVQLLIDLTSDVGIDANMITYISASMPDIQSILQVCEHSTGNLYATCSRTVASDIMNIYPKTIASTSGPNTLICTDWDKVAGTMSKTAQAIADSATIESSGQCTALRHCIVPTTNITDLDCSKLLLDNITTIDSPILALSESQYAGIIVPTPKNTTNTRSSVQHEQRQQLLTDQYQRLDTRQRHHDVDVYIKINNSNDDNGGGEFLTKKNIPEYWRTVVVDFTKLDLLQDKYMTLGKIQIRPIDENAVTKVASWLNVHQPISLAINGPRHESIMAGIAIWERTGLVVYTIGSTDHAESMPPAMTCQARPQDGECFGEFPPRNTMNQCTIFPVIIPSSNPSYDTTYKEEYLKTRGRELSDYMNRSTKNVLLAISNDAVRGYCVLLIEYLQNVCRKNPKLGSSKTRSVLYGIQRPPLRMKTILRCTQHTSYDDFVMIYILFQVTNARDQAEISIHPGNAHMIELCQQQLKLSITIQSDLDFVSQSEIRTDVFQTVTIPDEMLSLSLSPRFLMVGNFVSLYLPLGHIKSTMVNDDEFEMKVRMSDKWLNTLF